MTKHAPTCLANRSGRSRDDECTCGILPKRQQNPLKVVYTARQYGVEIIGEQRHVADMIAALKSREDLLAALEDIAYSARWDTNKCPADFQKFARAAISRATK